MAGAPMRLLLPVLYGLATAAGLTSTTAAQRSPPAGCGQMPPVQAPPILAHRPWMDARLPPADRTRLLLGAISPNGGEVILTPPGPPCIYH
jgi:hypothetical protein